MVLRILNVATFILLVWLTFQFGVLKSQVADLQVISNQHQQMLDNTLRTARQDNSKKLDELNEQIGKITASQGKNAEATKKLKAFQAKQGKLDTLRKAYILVLEAEAARVAKDTKTAQERLKASKALIWKSGSNYPKEKKSLQGLMKTIDITLGAWKRKDLSKNTKPIYSVVAKAIKKQDK